MSYAQLKSSDKPKARISVVTEVSKYRDGKKTHNPSY